MIVYCIILIPLLYLICILCTHHNTIYIQLLSSSLYLSIFSTSLFIPSILPPPHLSTSFPSTSLSNPLHCSQSPLHVSTSFHLPHFLCTDCSLLILLGVGACSRRVLTSPVGHVSSCSSENVRRHDASLRCHGVAILHGPTTVPTHQTEPILVS